MSNSNLTKSNIRLSSFLTVFFYIPQKKNIDMVNIIQFLQRYEISFKRFNNKNCDKFLHFVQNNANYIAESKNPILTENFEVINRFLSSKLIVVAFFYRNQFLNKLRYKKDFILQPFENIWTQFNKILF